MKTKLGTFIIAAMVLFNWDVSYPQDMVEVHEEYEAKKNVRIETASGDCIVKGGGSDKIIVHLEYSERLKDNFEPDIQERSNSIRIKERWFGRSSGGRVLWTITVPPTTEVELSTASGDVSLEDLSNVVDASAASGDFTILACKGELEVSTASGDIDITELTGKVDFSTASGDIKSSQLNGEVEFSTASGDIRIRNSEGSFELSCASGDIEASDLTLTEESSFSTASGDVEVGLAQSAEHDLEISTASGDAKLDYNGNEIKGYFEFTAKKRSGSIRSPIDFDREEEYGRNGDEYVRKSFTKGGKTPVVLISTSSGSVVLKD